MKSRIPRFLLLNALCLWTCVSCHKAGPGPTSGDMRHLPLAQLHKLGEQGDPQAQTFLGHKYFYGQGMPVDQVQGYQWYRKAAEQGAAEAQCFLAQCYGLGEGVAEDDSEAERWLRRSANQGYHQAQLRIGLNYLFGHGTNRIVDLIEAFKWLHLAATASYQAEDLDTSATAHQYLKQCERQMTPAQIDEARRRAREFRPIKESSTPPLR